jgi:hypothetical protein
MKLKTLLLTLVASAALAGDDYVATVAYTGTAACSSALKPRTNYAVICTTDCYVRVTSDTTNATATTNSVLVSANKLYDTPTTGTQTFLCAIQSASAGNMRIFQFRSKDQ